MAYFDGVFRRRGKFLIVFLLVLTTGMHWALLQSVAWASMLAGNLQTQTVAAAVERTFDGHHLCPLCRAIAAAKQSQKRTEASAPVLKFEYPPAAGALVLYPPTQFAVLPARQFGCDSSPSEPPVPPPRFLL